MKKVLLFILICLPLCFFGCDKQNLTKLATPKNLVVESGVITFERVANEGYYSIEINNLQILADINNARVEIYQESNINYFEFNAQNLFEVGKHYTIKVQACASGKKSSDFVSAEYVHHAKLSTPTNLAVANKVLSWAAVENAENYDLEIILPNGQSETKQLVKNSVDISNILTCAGEFNFKVRAKTRNENFSASDYATFKFENFIDLETPTDLNLTTGENLLLSAQIDERANAVELKINDEVRVVEKQNSAIQTEGKSWQINLNNLVAVFGGRIDFANLGNYQISLKAVFVTGAKNYYNPSAFSQSVNHVSTRQLAAPNVEIVEVGNLKIVKFSSAEIEHISGFKLEINLGENVTTYTFEANISSFVLPEDFVSVSVTALGRDFYLNSASTTVTKN